MKICIESCDKGCMIEFEPFCDYSWLYDPPFLAVIYLYMDAQAEDASLILVPRHGFFRNEEQIKL